MDKNITILDMGLNGYTTKEMIETVKEYLENDMMNIIGYISTSLLLAAHEDTVLKRYIEELDIAVISEKEILELANIETKQLYKEIEKNLFMEYFFQHITIEHHSIFILADTKKQEECLKAYLEKRYDGIKVIGSYVLEEENETDDAISNGINSVSPDVIVSILGTQFQERFVLENKKKLNAKIWLGLGHHEKARESIGLKPGWLSKLVDKTLLKRTVLKYNSEKGE